MVELNLEVKRKTVLKPQSKEFILNIEYKGKFRD